MFPKQIRIKEKKYLSIRWDNNSWSFIRLAGLRRACPCVNCKEEREMQGGGYIPIYNDTQLTITDIKINGNYAVNIIWKDGHSAGIYEYSMLNNLTEISSVNFSVALGNLNCIRC
ncbi:MAG: DUF971 domain-containing protein [Ignavibacteria bacterium]